MTCTTLFLLSPYLAALSLKRGITLTVREDIDPPVAILLSISLDTPTLVIIKEVGLRLIVVTGGMTVQSTRLLHQGILNTNLLTIEVGIIDINTINGWRRNGLDMIAEQGEPSGGLRFTQR